MSMQAPPNPKLKTPKTSRQISNQIHISHKKNKFITKIHFIKSKGFYSLSRHNIITLTCQPHAIQPVQDLGIRVPLDDDIGDGDLNHTPIFGDTATNPNKGAELDQRSEMVGRMGN